MNYRILTTRYLARRQPALLLGLALLVGGLLRFPRPVRPPGADSPRIGACHPGLYPCPGRLALHCFRGHRIVQRQRVTYRTTSGGDLRPRRAERRPGGRVAPPGRRRAGGHRAWTAGQRHRRPGDYRRLLVGRAGTRRPPCGQRRGPCLRHRAARRPFPTAWPCRSRPQPSVSSSQSAARARLPAATWPVARVAGAGLARACRAAGRRYRGGDPAAPARCGGVAQPGRGRSAGCWQVICARDAAC